MIYKEIYKYEQGITGAGQKGDIKEKNDGWSTTLPLRNYDQRWESSLSSKFQNMDIQVQRLSESNQWVYKMKPSGVHRQTQVSQVMCHVLKTYKHKPIITKQCNMKSVLSQVECNQIIILLLLVRHVCLGMCPSVPVHVHPHMSKMRLVIGNW